MRFRKVAVCLLISAGVIAAQSGRGTITNTISDPAASTASGNYTLTQLPAGPYEMDVTVPGFKKYVRRGITVEVAQTLRIDLALALGGASESVLAH